MIRPRHTLALAAVALAALAAGCGGGGHGRATLWVTRDEGRTLLVSQRVPAGETALQALERSAKVTTRYGGRFVESVNGIAGSIGSRHDWFYFVNGIEAPRGAAEYVLHPGDVEWWDYRDWGRVGQSVPVVVGAFPEPFLHGYGGKVPPAVVVGRASPGARALAHLLHARLAPTAPRGAADVLRLAAVGGSVFSGRARPAGGVELDYSGDPGRLARHPSLYRYRYSVG